jgi:hypothetical protein
MVSIDPDLSAFDADVCHFSFSYPVKQIPCVQY